MQSKYVEEGSCRITAVYFRRLSVKMLIQMILSKSFRLPDRKQYMRSLMVAVAIIDALAWHPNNAVFCAAGTPIPEDLVRRLQDLLAGETYLN